MYLNISPYNGVGFNCDSCWNVTLSHFGVSEYSTLVLRLHLTLT